MNSKPKLQLQTVRKSAVVGVAVVVCGLLGVAPIYALWAAGVPLGETDRFVYRYTQHLAIRLGSIVPLVMLVGAAWGAVWLLTARSAGKRLAGLLGCAAVMAGLAIWTWWAPPGLNMLEHALNFRSPSQDGAFVLEAEKLTTLGEYLRGFDQRLQNPPREMHGTRVLSNPPGATIVSRAVLENWPPDARAPSWLEVWLMEHGLGAEQVVQQSNALRVSIAWCVLWAASAGFAYGLGRLFLSPLGAALLALLITFNPATVHFAPGKDVAQLLTINAMLWAYLAGWRHKSLLAGIAAGGALVVGLTLGLIHLWVAMAIVAATGWEEWSGQPRRARDLGRPSPAAQETKRRRDEETKWRQEEQLQAAQGGMGGFAIWCLGAPAAGAALAVAAIYLGCGWNVPVMLWAVGRRFGQIQQTIPYSRGLWFVIGLPLFLLFLSAGFWICAYLSGRRYRRGTSFGRPLAICTGGCMLLTYLLGVTYELPRLWIAFLPLMGLAVTVELPLLRGRTMRRALMPVALIITVQILATGLHWAALDAREAEYRLTSHRYYQ